MQNPCSSPAKNAKFHRRFRLVVIFLGSWAVTSALPAGTWEQMPWTGDADLPVSSEKKFTHSLNFGSKTPVKVNGVVFQATAASVTGNNWELSSIPSETKNVWVVSLPADQKYQITGAGKSLVENMVTSRNKAEGLRIELSGLEPGRSFRLFFFNIGSDYKSTKRVSTVTASDEPDNAQPLDLNPKNVDAGNGYLWAYSYKAPKSGTLVVDFAQEDGDVSRPRFFALANLAE